MKTLALLAVACLATACATAPAQDSPLPARLVCSEGFAPLRFVPEHAALDPSFAKSVHWPAETVARCNLKGVAVVGLPEPSPTSLAGRRAASVVAILEAFGIPRLTFDLGDEEAQQNPVLVIDAAPR